jgi:hypothetical protein
VRKEIEQCFVYRDIRALQEGMRIFEENHPTRTVPLDAADRSVDTSAY